MNKKLAVKLATGLFVSLLFAAQAQASIILSNFPGDPNYSLGSNLGTNGLGDSTKAVGLTMGANSMNFVSMTALIYNDESSSVLSGGIYSDSSSNPDALLAAFTPMAVPTSDAVEAYMYTLTISGSFTLAADTSYWFVLDGPTIANVADNHLGWYALDPNVAPIASGDISYTGYRFSSDGGTSWVSSSTYNGVTIDASPVPLPGAVWLIGSGVVGLLGLRRKKS